jgi:hypothetical protein
MQFQCESNYQNGDSCDSIIEKVISSIKVTKRIIGILLEQVNICFT